MPIDYGQAAQDALKGGAAGAAIGSIVPGVGTAIGAGAGALIGLGGDVAGYFATQGQDANAQAALARSQAAYSGLAPAAVDTSGIAGQQNALTTLQGIYGAGGIDAQTGARLQGIENASNQQAQAQRAGIMQQAAQRGLLDSGTALASQQQAGQAAAQQGSQQAMEAAALGEQNRNAALAQASQTSANIQAGNLGIAQQTNQVNMARAAGLAGVGGQQAGQANLQGQQAQALGNAVGAGGAAAARGVGSYFDAPGGGKTSPDGTIKLNPDGSVPSIGQG